MEQFTPLVAMLVLAFAFGSMWYQLFGHTKTHWLKTMAFPLVGVIIGEGIWANYQMAGPEIVGIHPAVAVFSTMLAVWVEGVMESLGGLQFLRRIPSFQITVNGKTAHKQRAKTETPA